MSKTFLIIGATSSLGKEVTREIAKNQSSHFILLARDVEALKAQKKDLLLHGAKSVTTHFFEAKESHSFNELISTVSKESGEIDVALLAYGVLLDQRRCEESQEILEEQLQINGVSTVLLLEALAKQFIKQKKGTIAVIGSVAGDKGKRSNYAYGSAKAMVEIYTQGLRQRLNQYNVRLLLIKPGMVSTKMTAHFKQGILFSSCSAVSKKIVDALFSKRDVYYLPWFWRWILFVFKVMPESLFKRLKL